MPYIKDPFISWILFVSGFSDPVAANLQFERTKDFSGQR
jgi:hypothetical protein